MRGSMYPAVLLSAAACLTAAPLFSPVSAQATGQQPHAMPVANVVSASVPARELSAIRAATSKYQDIAVALKEGYVRDPNNMCVTSAMEGAPRQLGAMGVHYVRPDLLGLAGETPRVHGTGMHTDFQTPGVLIYEPQKDGSQKLVAIENLVWAKAWQDAGNKEAPSFHGNDYYYMQDNPLTPADEAHGFEPHYELHFWLYRNNPAGTFSPFNSTVNCEYHVQ